MAKEMNWYQALLIKTLNIMQQFHYHSNHARFDIGFPICHSVAVANPSFTLWSLSLFHDELNNPDTLAVINESYLAEYFFLLNFKKNSKLSFLSENLKNAATFGRHFTINFTSLVVSRFYIFFFYDTRFV